MSYRPTPKREFYDPDNLPREILDQVNGPVAGAELLTHDDIAHHEDRKPWSEFLVNMLGRKKPLRFSQRDGQWVLNKDPIPEDGPLPRLPPEKPQKNREHAEPCYLTQKQLDWLFALLHVNGDPLHVKSRLDEAKHLFKWRSDKLRELAARTNSSGAMAPVEDVPKTRKMKLCKACGEFNSKTSERCWKCKELLKQKAKKVATPELDAYALDELIRSLS